MGDSKYGYLKNLSLTSKQQEALDIIIEEKDKEFSPAELADKMGYSESNAVSNILKKFVRLGFLTKRGKGKKVKYKNENE